ncbi:Brp/Blh family beta-carotene 15,15'-dioxygenase [Flagellimonas sp.]|uniref:Brp/Blh family beta-carotene 15,15'-dioxygenase n=1 Tax=Flagellimonas sp. TaxID=2058762 RepID=UPI003F4A087C
MKLKSGMIVATVFSLWFSVYFDEYTEAAIAYTLIMSFGVLHGANDIRLIQSINLNYSKSVFCKIVLIYVSVVLSILILFYLFPILALSLFILVSGYHFGEQHWSQSVVVHSFWNILFYSLYGLFILFMLFNIKSEQVVPILEDVMQISMPLAFFDYSILFLGLGLLAIGSYYFLNKRVKRNLLEELFVLVVFFIIFKTASLLWGFCIYFIIWHSIPSLKDQMDYLYGESNWKTFGRYVKDSLLYWILSIIGLLALLWFLNGSSENMITILIYFLAAITFPHVIVMSRLEHKN